MVGKDPEKRICPLSDQDPAGGESRESTAAASVTRMGAPPSILIFCQFRASRAQGRGEERQPLTVRGEERRKPIL